MEFAFQNALRILQTKNDYEASGKLTSGSGEWSLYQEQSRKSQNVLGLSGGWDLLLKAYLHVRVTYIPEH